MEFENNMNIKWNINNAVDTGDLEVVKLLLSNYLLSFSYSASRGYNLLKRAVRKNQTKVAKLLLERGFEVNNEYMETSSSPLHFAIKHNNIQIIRILLYKGANTNAEDNNGRTPLYDAIGNKNIEIIKLLLAFNADVNAKDKTYISPLQYAIMHLSSEIVEFLLKHGACVNYVRTVCKNPAASSSLHLATRYNYKEVIMLLLNNDANINIRGINNITPLYVACEHGYTDVVILFLNRGADVKACDMDRSTPLHIATRKGYESIVKLLLQNGANVDNQDKNGRTTLNLAVETECSVIVEDILKYRPDINNKSNIDSLKIAMHGHDEENNKILEALLKYGFSIDVKGTELLNVAIEVGNLEIVKVLLKNGFDANSTFLHNAVKNKQEEIIKLLISYGANINAQDNAGKTPLLYAINNADLNFVKLLLSNGASVKDNPELLNNAINKNSLEIVEALIHYNVDINAINEYGRTALHFTTLNESIDLCVNSSVEDDVINAKAKIAKLLLSNGANVDAQTENGLTTLHAASQKGYLKVVEVLMNHGADINICDINGNTALHFIGICNSEYHDYDIDRDKAKITKMLLSNDAKVDAQTKDGLTALHIATESGCKNIVEILLEYNAYVNCKAKNGLTPLHIAAKKGFQEIVKIILKFGASINSRDNSGTTALHIASLNNDLEVVRIILEYGSCYNKFYSGNKTPLQIPTNMIRSFRSEIKSITVDGYYDDLDYMYLFKREVVQVFQTYIIKLKAAKLYKMEKKIKILRFDEGTRDHEDACVKEIVRLKNEMIGNSSISFYDILVKTTNSLATCMRNENIEQVLKLENYKIKFPIYASMIECYFIKSMIRKQLIEKTNDIVHLLSNFPKLPCDCIEKIFSYLHNRDLRILFYACLYTPIISNSD